jgi:hypothetical protein
LKPVTVTGGATLPLRLWTFPPALLPPWTLPRVKPGLPLKPITVTVGGEAPFEPWTLPTWTGRGPWTLPIWLPTWIGCGPWTLPT